MKLKRMLSVILASLMLMSVCMTGIAVSADSDLPFTDVKNNWTYEYVKYVYETGLMNGVGDGSEFAPAANLTRAMAVTVLYRNSGSPDADYSNVFSDVPAGKYYSKAVAWAYKNGIVKGTGEDEWAFPIFSPDNKITRQELATMFARYAKYNHVDTTKNTTDISNFSDNGKVAGWAADAMKWAVGTGLITGQSNGGKTTLAPKANATRAEFAAIIMRYNDKDAAREFSYLLAYETPVVQSTYTAPEYTLVKDADVYVAVDGDDDNPGTLEEPLATFAAAKAKVNEIKADAKGEIVVAFKAGNYGELDSLTFTDADSGTASAPITYCAYGDGEVIFSNGCLIDESEFKVVDESDMELLGNVDTSKIKKADLTGKFDKFSERSALFSESGFCHEARYPNKNYDGSDFYYANLTTTVDERSSIQLSGPLLDIVKSFRTTDGMKITGYLRTGWLIDTFYTKSYDPETNIVTFDFENHPPLNYTLDQFPLMEEGRTDDMVFFHNLSDQIDDEGEYWFDETTKQLYVYEPKGNYAISHKGNMLRIEESEYLNFVGLTFTCSTDTAINAYISDHLTFDRCNFAYISGNGCIGTWGGSYVTVENCELRNFACSGIYINRGGNIDLLEECHNVVRNNYLHDFGDPKYFASSGGIAIQDNVGIVVEHNHLVNGAHGGIVFNGTVDAIIRYNVLDDMVNNSKDYGAIYGGGKARRGNQICYNLIMNMYDSMGNARESYGVYIDECGSGQEVFGNIFYNGGGHAVTLNGGRENNIHDNIIINANGRSGGDFLMTNEGPYGLIIEGTPELITEHESYTDLIAERPAKGESGYDKWYARFPEVYNFNIDPANVGKADCLFTTINFVRNNVIIGSDISSSEMFEKFAVNENNTVYTLDENTLFTDPTHGDYSFKEDVTFFDIDISKIGRYSAASSDN